MPEEVKSVKPPPESESELSAEEEARLDKYFAKRLADLQIPVPTKQTEPIQPESAKPATLPNDVEGVIQRILDQREKDTQQNQKFEQLFKDVDDLKKRTKPKSFWSPLFG
jgi:endonuclease III